MKLNKKERMAMDFFDDDNLEMTIQRLCWTAMLSPNQEIKKMLCGLIDKLQGEEQNNHDCIKMDE